MEIKRVLSCIAFKNGIIEELEDLKSMNGGNFNEIIPKLGSVREDEFSSMRRYAVSSVYSLKMVCLILIWFLYLLDLLLIFQIVYHK